MSKYSRGKIYKIVNIASNDPHDFYVGSTINELRTRFQGHRNAWKQHVDGKRNDGLRLYEVFSQFGIANFKIVLIENYPCNTYTELLQREEAIRIREAPNYNVARAYLDPVIKQQENVVALKKWREENPDAKKEWCEKNSHRYVCEACKYNTSALPNMKRHFTCQKHKRNQEKYDFDFEINRLADIDITLFD